MNNIKKFYVSLFLLTSPLSTKGEAAPESYYNFSMEVINNKKKYKNYAEKKILEKWKKIEYVHAFFWIVENESDWNPHAQNKKSTAYGIGQFLDSTWSAVGYTKTSDPYVQIDAMIEYISVVYKNPITAKNSKKKKGWY